MTGEELYLMTQAIGLQAVFTFLTVLIIIIALSGFISSITRLRKSQLYRKHFADLYVAAKIKFFAKEDGLDLVEEENNFKDWCKKSRRNKEGYDLDNAVEDELMDRVEEPVKKKETKK
jgi:hypothetical protein